MANAQSETCNGMNGRGEKKAQCHDMPGLQHALSPVSCLGCVSVAVPRYPEVRPSLCLHPSKLDGIDCSNRQCASEVSKSECYYSGLTVYKLHIHARSWWAVVVQC